MAELELSAEEIAWIAENRETIRNLMSASPTRRKAIRDELADPLERAARGLASSIRSRLQEIEVSVKETQSRLQFGRELIEQNREEGKAPRAMDVEYVENRGPASLAALLARKSHLERKLRLLGKHREAVFLPLGTVVRFVGVEAHGERTGLGEDALSYPVDGSVGVVTRIAQKGQHGLSVSMRRPFKDGWGTEFEPQDDVLPTFKVDREMLAVVSYARLPNGEEYHGYGFVPTYAPKSETDDPEMILDADGHYWRFHDYGGEQSVEALQAFESLDEMPWIGEPTAIQHTAEVPR